MLVAVLILVLMAVVLVVVAANLSGTARNDTTPVNLSTPVDMANGLAHRSAIVRAGKARIEVLSPTLLRLEYSPSDNFENSPTVNAINRRMAVPKYSARVCSRLADRSDKPGHLALPGRVGALHRRQHLLAIYDGNSRATVHPTWDWECPFDQTCQAGAAVLTGGASLNWNQSGYQSSAGYRGRAPPPWCRRHLEHPGGPRRADDHVHPLLERGERSLHRPPALARPDGRRSSGHHTGGCADHQRTAVVDVHHHDHR